MPLEGKTLSEVPGLHLPPREGGIYRPLSQPTGDRAFLFSLSLFLFESSMPMAHYSLKLLSLSDPPAPAFQVAGTISESRCAQLCSSNDSSDIPFAGASWSSGSPPSGCSGSFIFFFLESVSTKYLERFFLKKILHLC